MNLQVLHKNVLFQILKRLQSQKKHKTILRSKILFQYIFTPILAYFNAIPSLTATSFLKS